ncbi:hypothetical protein M1437_00005, partial [Patescibacteria group bacterium]|nr:hypothetical protein [Patescibacteria group bacterium]
MKGQIKALTIIVLIFLLTSCSNTNDLPRVSAEVRSHFGDDGKVYALEWKIKNLDEEQILHFKNGNIMNYTIIHNATHKTHLSSKDPATITLGPGEVYTKKISYD